jgi:6-phosphogluconolactonase (cycloisomerase 2 family)
MKFSPDGKFIYLLNELASSVTTFAWDAAAGADSNTVSVHKIDPATGELTYLTKGVINVPAPICIVFAKP